MRKKSKVFLFIFFFCILSISLWWNAKSFPPFYLSIQPLTSSPTTLHSPTPLLTAFNTINLPPGDYLLSFEDASCLQDGYKYVTNPSLLLLPHPDGASIVLAARALYITSKSEGYPFDTWHSDIVLAEATIRDSSRLRNVGGVKDRGTDVDHESLSAESGLQDALQSPLKCKRFSFFSPDSMWRNLTCQYRFWSGNTHAYGPEDPKLFLWSSQAWVLFGSRPLGTVQECNDKENQDVVFSQYLFPLQASSPIPKSRGVAREAKEQTLSTGRAAPLTVRGIDIAASDDHTDSPEVSVDVLKELAGNVGANIPQSASSLFSSQIARVDSLRDSQSSMTRVDLWSTWNITPLSSAQVTLPSILTLKMGTIPIRVRYDPTNLLALGEDGPFREMQKNFSPFVVRDQLHLSYSLCPHVVLALADNGAVRETYTSPSNAIFDWLFKKLGRIEIRGNTPAVLVDAHSILGLDAESSALKLVPPFVYIAIMHYQAPHGYGYYYHHVYIFAPTPPFTILGVSCELPLTTKARFYRPGLKPKVAYASGVAVHGHSLLISYGSGDSEARVLVMDFRKLRIFLQDRKNPC